VELRKVLLVAQRRLRDRFDRALDVGQRDLFHVFVSSPPALQAALCAASACRSFSVTRTFGGSPSSGTTLTASVKSSSIVYVLVVMRQGMPAPCAASKPLRLSSITMQLEPGRPSRSFARL